jgi:hypothetical protein
VVAIGTEAVQTSSDKTIETATDVAINTVSKSKI